MVSWCRATLWSDGVGGDSMTADGATERIEPQGWMTAPESQAVIAALSAEGSEVRFVGGCVRDALAGRPVKDVDLATPDRPGQVMALLQAAGLKAVQWSRPVEITDRKRTRLNYSH